MEEKDGIPSSVALAFRRIGIDLSEFVFDAAVADLESLDFAEPAFAFRLDDAGFEIVADLFEPGALCGVRSQE
jgi:hypothetical protein